MVWQTLLWVNLQVDTCWVQGLAHNPLRHERRAADQASNQVPQEALTFMVSARSTFSRPAQRGYVFHLPA